jgi:hypothetical protein
MALTLGAEMKKTVIALAFTVLAGGGIADLAKADSTAITDARPVVCPEAGTWMMPDDPGYYTQQFKGLTVERGLIKAEFCLSGARMNRWPAPVENSYTLFKEEIDAKLGDYRNLNMSASQKIEYMKGANAIHALAKKLTQ